MAQDQADGGSTLLTVIQTAAISPTDAKKLVANIRNRSRRKGAEDDTDFHARIAEQVADKIVARYSKLSAVSGGLTALVGVVPGVGTILAAVGGGVADTAICMKLQVDMCMCIAEAYGWDLHNEDARHLGLLIAAGASLEHVGTEVGTRVASKAGVKMLQQYLKGAALQALKALFKKIGIIFTRKALERAPPFGIGVVLGSTANYALARYVGAQARDWFKLERENRNSVGAT
jgi:hypothetical protein